MFFYLICVWKSCHEISFMPTRPLGIHFIEALSQYKFLWIKCIFKCLPQNDGDFVAAWMWTKGHTRNHLTSIDNMKMKYCRCKTYLVKTHWSWRIDIIIDTINNGYDTFWGQTAQNALLVKCACILIQIPETLTNNITEYKAHFANSHTNVTHIWTKPKYHSPYGQVNKTTSQALCWEIESVQKLFLNARY